MIISLTDTNDDDTDVHINDWMVENRLAEFGKVVRIRSNFLVQNNKRQLYGISATHETRSESSDSSRTSSVSSSFREVCDHVDIKDQTDKRRSNIYRKLFADKELVSNKDKDTDKEETKLNSCDNLAKASSARTKSILSRLKRLSVS